MSFIKSLFMSPEEKAFLNGINGFVAGQYDRAYSYFQQNTNDPDSAFMCGFIALGKGNYGEAERHFSNCLPKVNELGKTMSKVKGDFELILDITDYIEAPVNLDNRGLILALAEAYQGQGKYEAALNIMDKLWDENLSDKVVCLSLIDLVTLWPGSPGQFFKDIVEMTSGMENEEPIDTNILYLRGYSLYRLGLYDAAAKQLSDILRKTKDRPEALLLKIRYMRGRIYEEQGYTQKARSDYEKIYTGHPDFSDVKVRLGL